MLQIGHVDFRVFQGLWLILNTSAYFVFFNLFENIKYNFLVIGTDLHTNFGHFS